MLENKLIEILEAMKNNNQEKLEELVDFYCSPCYLKVPSSTETNSFVNYLMVLYRSNFFRGTVHYANENYYPNGYLIKNSCFNNLKNEEILKIIGYCIQNKAFIEDLFYMLKFDLENFEQFKEKYEDFLIFKKDYFKEGNNFNSLIKILGLGTNLEISKINENIQKFEKLELQEKVTFLKEKIEKEALPSLYLEYLYKEDFMVEYALDLFKKIKTAEIFLPGDCEYHCAVLIDPKIAEELSKNNMLPLFFNKGNISRGPSCIQLTNRNDEVFTFINVAHGDNILREIFLEFIHKLDSKIIYEPYDFVRE